MPRADRKRLLRQLLADYFGAQIRTIRTMGECEDLLRIPHRRERTAALNSSDKSSSRVVQCTIDDAPSARSLRSSRSRSVACVRLGAQVHQEVKDLLDRDGECQQRWGQLVSRLGLLGKLPGVQADRAAAQMKGMTCRRFFGKDASMMEQPRSHAEAADAWHAGCSAHAGNHGAGQVMAYSDRPQGR